MTKIRELAHFSRFHRSKGALFSLLILSSLGLIFLPAPSKYQADNPSPFPPPLDPQQVKHYENMTWDDYQPLPGRNWADPSIKPEKGFKLAVVAVDFPNQPFVITLPKGSDPFGNPQIDPIPREKVPQFYADFFTKPTELNHGLNIHKYWMEQSRGKFGLTAATMAGLMPSTAISGS